MIAVDTNVLVYGHRSGSNLHTESDRWLRHLTERSLPFGLPVFCIPEFLRVTTHSRVFDPASDLEDAWAFIDAVTASPACNLLRPSADFIDHLRDLTTEAPASGNLVFDAQIAATCREHGVETILSADSDMQAFPDLEIRHPTDPPPTT